MEFYKNSPNKILWPENEVQKIMHTANYAFIQKYLAITHGKKGSILNIEVNDSNFGEAKEGNQHFDKDANQIVYTSKTDAINIERTPFQDNAYDIIICLGRTLNNADPLKAFAEFRRILRPKGFLLLEFENSNTSKFIFKRDFNKKAVFTDKYCTGKALWYYSDKWINELAGFNKLQTIKKYKFNYFVSLKYKFYKNKNSTSSFLTLEKVLRRMPFVQNLSSNTVILCQKTPN